MANPMMAGREDLNRLYQQAGNLSNAGGPFFDLGLGEDFSGHTQQLQSVPTHYTLVSSQGEVHGPIHTVAAPDIPAHAMPLVHPTEQWNAQRLNVNERIYLPDSYTGQSNSNAFIGVNPGMEAPVNPSLAPLENPITYNAGSHPEHGSQLTESSFDSGFFFDSSNAETSRPQNYATYDANAYSLTPGTAVETASTRTHLHPDPSQMSYPTKDTVPSANSNAQSMVNFAKTILLDPHHAVSAQQWSTVSLPDVPQTLGLSNYEFPNMMMQNSGDFPSSTTTSVPYVSNGIQPSPYANNITFQQPTLQTRSIPPSTQNFDDLEAISAQTMPLPPSSTFSVIQAPYDTFNFDMYPIPTIGTNKDGSDLENSFFNLDEVSAGSELGSRPENILATQDLPARSGLSQEIFLPVQMSTPMISYQPSDDVKLLSIQQSLSTAGRPVENRSTSSVESSFFVQKSLDSPSTMLDLGNNSISDTITPEFHKNLALEIPSEPVGSVTSRSRVVTDTTRIIGAQSNKKQDLEIIMYGQKEPSRKRKDTGVDLSNDEPIAQIIKYDDSGQIQTIENTFGNPMRKVKGPYDAAKRKDVADSRAFGVCANCERGKKECDLHKKSPFEQCTACQMRKRTYKNIPRLPCFLSQIVDTVFFRKGPSYLSPQYFQNRNIGIFEICSSNQQSSDLVKGIRTLQLTQIHGATLEVYVKQYIACVGDKVDCCELDQNGKECVFKMPPYCLADLPKVRSNIKTYIHRERARYLNLLQVSDGADSITSLTAKVALAHAAQYPNSVTSMALDLWAYCRVIEREWTICGPETLGLSKIADPSSPWHTFIPITTMMDVQLDQIIIQDILGPLRHRLILALEDMIKHHIPIHWFDCYLTMYLLLNHMEWACEHGNKFSKRYGLGRRYSDMKLAESWFFTSKILLSRFHFWSNGSDPFKVDWADPENVKFAKLKKDQVQFMQQLKTLVNEKDLHFKELKEKHRYETDMYWTHQLFRSKWDSGLPHIVEETWA